MFPDDLRYWRELQGVSQTRLAALLNRRFITINAWECGRRRIPSWLPDWLEHLEFQVGAGKGVPFCPHAVGEINLVLYQWARDKKARSERWREAGKVRKEKTAARDERRTARQLRALNRQRMVDNRQDPGRYHVSMARDASFLPSAKENSHPAIKTLDLPSRRAQSDKRGNHATFHNRKGFDNGT